MNCSPVGWPKVSRRCPLATCQSFTAESPPALASTVPSGLKAMPCTGPLCPSSVRSSFPVRVFHNLMRRSYPAVAARVPSGESAAPYRVSRCPSLKVCWRRPVLRFHSTASPRRPVTPEAASKKLPSAEKVSALTLPAWPVKARLPMVILPNVPSARTPPRDTAKAVIGWRRSGVGLASGTCRVARMERSFSGPGAPAVTHA